MMQKVKPQNFIKDFMMFKEVIGMEVMDMLV